MYQQKIEEYFDKHKDEMYKSLSEIMSIDSSFSEPVDTKPFGEGSAKALAWAGNFGKSIGMNVKNFDNYAISMDYKEGEPALGILAHLDVVPAGEGWNYPPFACTIDGKNIYGRGAIDDKGPSVAVLYAAKCIHDLDLPVEKNFRLIFGGNEEGGCTDIEYYQQKENFPPNVFTPDGSFPVLNCEKGMVHLSFSGNGNFDTNEIKFSKITGGTVVNAIPGKTICKAVVSDNLRFNQLSDCSVNGTVEGFEIIGQSAHGSRPENGRNTITALMSFLAHGGNALALSLSKIFPHGERNGKSLGLGFSDDVSGEMTTALTTLDYENGKFKAGVDIRFPIDKSYEEIVGIVTDTLNKAGFELDECDGMEPHYVPEDSEFVKSLLSVYEKVSGKKGYCIAEGGVTYVHNTEGGVAFGAEFPEESNNMHGADEHISLETFRQNFLMYTNAILELTV